MMCSRLPRLSPRSMRAETVSDTVWACTPLDESGDRRYHKRGRCTRQSAATSQSKVPDPFSPPSLSSPINQSGSQPWGPLFFYYPLKWPLFLLS